MQAHYCINPLDPYAEQEVLVTYEDGHPLASIVSATDDGGYDILAELSDECIRVLQLELAVYHGGIEPYGWTHDAVDAVATAQVA